MDEVNRTSGWARAARWLPWVLLAVAPALQAQYYSRPYVPPAENTSETNRHLSPACATLNDAIAAANRQGQYTTAQTARQEFNRKCADELQEAMQKRYQQQQGERERRLDEKRQAEMAQDQAAQLAQQCEGMRDVIALRRKRERDNALNPTEVQALRQLEASYNSRCLRR
jgi:hypothetical protein